MSPSSKACWRGFDSAVRDIAVRAWDDYLAWANPTAHSTPAHFGKASLKKGGDILVDPAADFTKLKLEEMAADEAGHARQLKRLINE